jgi:GDP-L-fucose synthase
VLSENDISFEGDIGMPDMTYGWAKLTNEYLGILAHEKYGLNVACYRPFSGYGEDQDLTYPFPAICERAIKHTNEEPFVVWGSGNQGRDFIYINDVVNGVLQTYSELKDGHGVNLSTGSLTTFIELAKMVLTYLGKEVDVIGDESMPSGVFARVGSPDRLSALGFVAETEIFEGVARCVDYRKSVVSSEAGEKDV